MSRPIRSRNHLFSVGMAILLLFIILPPLPQIVVLLKPVYPAAFSSVLYDILLNAAILLQVFAVPVGLMCSALGLLASIRAGRFATLAQALRQIKASRLATWLGKHEKRVGWVVLTACVSAMVLIETQHLAPVNRTLIQLPFPVIAQVLAFLLARRGSLRRRLTMICFSFAILAVTFGLIYYYVFLQSPTSFAFANAIREGEAYAQFDTLFADLKTMNSKLYVLGSIAAEADLGYRMFRSKEVLWNQEWPTDTTVKYQFPGQVSASCAILNYGGKMPFDEDGVLVLAAWIGAEPVTLGIMNAGRLGDHEDKALAMLFGARDLVRFRSLLDTLITAVAEKRSETLASLKMGLGAQPEWGAMDFCYFSVVAMTTLGYGDILPNSRSVRLIVMCQVIIGIFYVGYAIYFVQSGTRRVRTKGNA